MWRMELQQKLEFLTDSIIICEEVSAESDGKVADRE